MVKAAGRGPPAPRASGKEMGGTQRAQSRQDDVQKREKKNGGDTAYAVATWIAVDEFRSGEAVDLHRRRDGGGGRTSEGSRVRHVDGMPLTCHDPS